MDYKDEKTSLQILNVLRQFHRHTAKQSPVSGLKQSEFRVLHCIQKRSKLAANGIKVSDISTALDVSSPTITQSINTLEANGYVERTVDKQDRRAVRVKLTNKGEQAIEKAVVTMVNFFDGLVEHLGQEESNELIELLTKVLVYFDENKKTLELN